MTMGDEHASCIPRRSEDYKNPLNFFLLKKRDARTNLFREVWSPEKVDMVIIRENTEGLYSGIGERDHVGRRGVRLHPGPDANMPTGRPGSSTLPDPEVANETHWTR